MPFQSFNFLFRIEPTKEFKDLTVNSNLFKLPNHGAVFVLFNRLFQLGLFISPTRHIILSVGPIVYFGRRQSINGIIRGRRRNDLLRVGEAVNLDIPVRPRSQSSVATSRLIRRLIWFARPKLRPSVYCFIAADWTASLPAHEWASCVLRPLTRPTLRDHDKYLPTSEQTACSEPRARRQSTDADSVWPICVGCMFQMLHGSSRRTGTLVDNLRRIAM